MDIGYIIPILLLGGVIGLFVGVKIGAHEGKKEAEEKIEKQLLANGIGHDELRQVRGTRVDDI